MSSSALPPLQWDAPPAERLVTLDAALALLLQASGQATRLRDDVARLVHLVDWRADAAEAFQVAVSEWQAELLRLSDGIQAQIDRSQSERYALVASG